jgi:hypothetical protein
VLLARLSDCGQKLIHPASGRLSAPYLQASHSASTCDSTASAHDVICRCISEAGDALCRHDLRMLILQENRGGRSVYDVHMHMPSLEVRTN